MLGEKEFLEARTAIDRSAFTQFKLARGISSKDREAASAAYAEFCKLRLLDAPELRTLCLSALEESRGPRRTGAEPFPATLWLGGARDAHGGRAFTGSLRAFAEVLLPERTKQVNPAHDPKRGGWVLEPTTNPEGRRTNEHTLAVHALFLDCDSTGEWYSLLGALADLELAHVAYQSGGWSPTTPKWRIVLPLSKPHDTSDEAGRVRWKLAYNHARVVFGCLAGLSGHGFDPATETPCCPWFLTERRSAADPPRQIVWRPGHSLDLGMLIAELPHCAEPVVEEREYIQADPLSLDAAKFEEIVDALSAATAHVPHGRRDIYLAMPAVLLQRGLSPDDVRKVVEEVSARYPRVHPDKHADNMHNAETTITKWESEGPSARITQIGTLQNLAPEVAAAFDLVLPDLTKQSYVETLSAQLGVAAQSMKAPELPTPLAPTPVQYIAETAPAKIPVKPVKRRGTWTPLEKRLAKAAKRLRKHKLADRQFEGLLMLATLQRLPLPTTDPAELHALVLKLSRSIGYQLSDITWMEALELMSPTLLVMDFTKSTEKVRAAEVAFYEGKGARGKAKLKKEKKKMAEQERRAANAWESAR